MERTNSCPVAGMNKQKLPTGQLVVTAAERLDGPPAAARTVKGLNFI